MASPVAKRPHHMTDGGETTFDSSDAAPAAAAAATNTVDESEEQAQGPEDEAMREVVAGVESELIIRHALQGADLWTLATRLHGLNALVHLDLGHNALGELPPLASMTQLRTLLLPHNRLRAVPPDLPATLRRLDLRSNRIALIAHLQHLVELEWLSLSCNAARFESLSTVPPALPNLTFLGIYGNDLDDEAVVSDLLQRCPSLTELNLAGNPVCETLNEAHALWRRTADRHGLQPLHWLDGIPLQIL